MGHKPRIGITMRLELDSRRFYLGRDYSEAVETCGGTPVHISLIPTADYVERVLADLDGILLPGSNTDVDPHIYGEEPHPALGTVIPEKDRTDQLVIAGAERLNMPLLAICYGMQALNVSRGGTLIQDIGSQVDGCLKHEQGAPANRNSHGLVVEKGSFLSGLEAIASAGGDIRVNSSHHQSVGKLGRDLSVSARAKDGVIEAIEDTRPDRFNLGVQWHPELNTSTDRLSRAMFDAFIEKCARFAA